MEKLERECAYKYDLNIFMEQRQKHIGQWTNNIEWLLLLLFTNIIFMLAHGQLVYIGAYNTLYSVQELAIDEQQARMRIVRIYDRLETDSH